ncbi:MAG: TPM domain-containing protein [Acidobacteriota bacterium]
MKIKAHSGFGPALAFVLLVGVLSSGYIGVSSRAQEKPRLPERTGYVNDFAGVLDEKTKQRLEATLDYVKRRSGIEFGVATVQTSGGQDIFDFSNLLAADWKLGSRNAPSKSLLLVVSVDEKGVFTQFSKSVQTDLPEGILGEIGRRVRGQISSGHFNEGVSAGVDHFVESLAKKMGFSLQDIDQSAAITPDSSRRVATPATTVADVAATITKPPDKTPDQQLAVTTQPTKTNETAVAAPPVTSADSSVAPADSAVMTQPSAGNPDEKATVPTPSLTATRNRIANPTPAKSTSKKSQPNTAADDEAEAEQVELTLTLPLAERARKLTEFLAAYSNSKARPRAIEMLISTHAGLGDERLKNGDSKGGTEQLMLAISEAPTTISDKLFGGVIAQIPSNLYLRGQRDDAIAAARMIEAKFGTDPKRLLSLAGFYLGIEDGEEAARIGGQAVKLAPDLADAHRALGLGLHLSLRLDEAVTQYKRALELDPNTKKGTRSSLADLDRASGKAEEALVLYRAQMVAEPNDKTARAGVVLSLLELGRIDEANKELDAALQADPYNLTLLTGASYWFVAHKQSDRALELAGKAVQIEPRYTWAQIALARALISQKNPLAAERAIRFAGQYGRFPTIDYELANVLAAVGLYDEAADVLQRSFVLKEGQLETHLAGRVPARASSFTELLAPERRASIFQFTAAENANEAAMLKALLALDAATTLNNQNEKLDESRAIATAKEFAAGTDDMRVYRQLYAASRLLQGRVGFATVVELTEAARLSAEAALGVPAATVAVQPEELREMRARAILQGGTLDVPEAPRNLLSNILRGRIEDLEGLALFNQDKTNEAVEHFKRAANILPEGTPLWRNVLWHLGASLEQAGNKPEALNNYIKSFNAVGEDPLRRAVIEQLYRKMKGSLDGLDDRIGAKAVTTTSSAPVQTSRSPEPTPVPTPTTPDVTQPAPAATSEVTASSEPSPSPTPAATTPSPDAKPQTLAAEAALATVPVVPAKVTLSGRIRGAGDKGIANVVVVLISPRGTVLASTTDAEGNYSFVVAPSSQSYRIIPSKDGFSFAPLDKVLAGFNEDQKAVDFVGTQKP